jgi:hypothetical protein
MNVRVAQTGPETGLESAIGVEKLGMNLLLREIRVQLISGTLPEVLRELNPAWRILYNRVR